MKFEKVTSLGPDRAEAISFRLSRPQATEKLTEKVAAVLSSNIRPLS